MEAVEQGAVARTSILRHHLPSNHDTAVGMTANVDGEEEPQRTSISGQTPSARHPVLPTTYRSISTY